MLKTWKQCSQIIYRGSDGDVTNAGFGIEFIYGEPVWENSWPVLYNKGVAEILRRQMLQECNEDSTFRRSHNARGAACHPVNYKWFEKVEEVTVQRGLCLGKPRGCWNEKARSGRQSAVGLIQVYSDKAGNKMKCGALVMYAVLAVLLNFSTDPRWNHIFNGQTLVGFLPAKYEEDYCTEEGINKRKCSENATTNEASEFVLLENFIAQTTVPKGREETMKVMHRRIRSVSDGIYWSDDEGFEVTTSSVCWRLVPVVYCIVLL